MQSTASARSMRTKQPLHRRQINRSNNCARAPPMVSFVWAVKIQAQCQVRIQRKVHRPHQPSYNPSPRNRPAQVNQSSIWDKLGKAGCSLKINLFFTRLALGAPRHLKKAWLQRHTGEDMSGSSKITTESAAMVTSSSSSSSSSSNDKPAHGTKTRAASINRSTDSVHSFDVGVLAVNSKNKSIGE